MKGNTFMSHRSSLMDNKIIVTHASLRCSKYNIMRLNVAFKKDSSSWVSVFDNEVHQLARLIENSVVTHVPKFDTYFIDQWIMLSDYHDVSSLVQFLLNYKNNPKSWSSRFFYAIEAVEHFAI